MNSKVHYVGRMKYYVGMPIPVQNIIKSYLVQYSSIVLSSNIIDTLSLQITETIESYFKDNHIEDLTKKTTLSLDDYFYN